MSSTTIKGKEYIEYGGCFVPVDYVREDKKVSRPEDILHFVAEYKLSEQEHFIAITLDGSSQVINTYEITKGLANQSQIHPRELFKKAILDNAVKIIIVHNHPSGNLSPSVADWDTTKRLIEASKIIGIGILDHIIISSHGQVSMRAEDSEQFE